MDADLLTDREEKITKNYDSIEELAWCGRSKNFP